MRVGRMSWVIAALLGAGFLVGVAAAHTGGDPERGGELYVEYCSMCHGQDGRGRIGANLESYPGIQAGAALEQVIAEGIPGSVMPAWSQAEGGPLNDQDIRDIAAYLEQVLGGTRPIAPAPTYVPPEIPPLPDIEGEPSNGAVVFQNNCIACHGEKAQGGFGWPLAKTWPGNQPQVYLHQIISQGIDGTVMPAWAAEQGGPLTDQEIDDVTAYLLSLNPQPSPAAPSTISEGPLSLSVSLIIFAALGAIVILALVIYYRRA